jgi:hypothetical protein
MAGTNYMDPGSNTFDLMSRVLNVINNVVVHDNQMVLFHQPDINLSEELLDKIFKETGKATLCIAVSPNPVLPELVTELNTTPGDIEVDPDSAQDVHSESSD